MNPGDLRALEPDFWRAPSAHNTQPWTLRYRDGSAEIGWDPAYALPVADPTGRDLRLGLGAFTETCLIVCADAGLAVGFRPDYDQARRRIGHLVAADEPYRTPFTVGDVRARRSGRVPYRPGRLDDAVFRTVAELAEAAGARTLRLPCRRLAGLLYDADRHMFGDPAVTRELRAWLRLSPRDPRYDRDGLTDRALRLGRAEALGLRAVLSPRAYPLLRRVGLPRLLAASSRGLLDYDGDVLVLVGPAGCPPEGQVAMGRVLMRQWLALSRLGHTTHPLSQIIDAPATRAALARLLDVDDPARLLSVVRVGRPAEPPPRSARRVR
ncbi:hypothetical protein [Actinomadura miaoliensis]|uniref:Nitroreductase family protein n=1 Tax=Actinomadura miaoliensis TaxID=430685 RepID=A0ABP7W9M5_9ACTN